MTVPQQAQERQAPVFVRHTGIAAPFLQHNVNTDVISPLNPNPILPGASNGERAFEGIRYFQDGTENPDFFINQEPYRRASIMLTGRNFGTGSSRGTGVTWPMAMGIRVVIAPSFGPIFETNAFRYGMLAVPLEFEVIERLTTWVEADHGVDYLVRYLVALHADLAARGDELELHLIGHSAGSIVLGHMLDSLAARSPVSGSDQRLHVNTCSLYAAACSVRFAVDHYVKAANSDVLSLDKLWLYVLSDRNEKDDGLPSPEIPAYGKSLLYLVSRALDDARKMPLLGFERALDPKYASDADQWKGTELEALRAWQAAWAPQRSSAGETLLKVLSKPRVRSTREGDEVPATHGSFDNNIDVLSETLERIKGSGLMGEMEWLDY